MRYPKRRLVKSGKDVFSTVLTMFHCPVRFGTLKGVGSTVGCGVGLEGLGAGVAVWFVGLLPLAGESHLFMRYRNATAPPPSRTASRTRPATNTQRDGESEDWIELG